MEAKRLPTRLLEVFTVDRPHRRFDAVQSNGSPQEKNGNCQANRYREYGGLWPKRSACQNRRSFERTRKQSWLRFVP